MTTEATPATQAAHALEAASRSDGSPSASPGSASRPSSGSSTHAPDGTGAPSGAGDATVIAPQVGRLAWAALAAMILASAGVFWAFDALPFMDLPAHAGLIAMRHRFETSPFEQRYFVYAPHIGPYSLFRFLGELFVGPLGPVGAVRALATLPAVATPLALLFARRRLHGDRSTTFGYFGVILSFGLMTLFGFASYLLGVAVMLVGLTLFLELLVAADARSPLAGRREVAVAVFAPFIFVAHGHAFVLFLALAGLSCLVTGNPIRRLVRLRALAPAVALAAYVAWIERGATAPLGSVAVSEGKMTPFFQGPYDKLSLLITPTLMTRSGVDAAVGVAVWVLVGAALVATVRRLRLRAAAVSDEVGELHAAGRAAPHARALVAGMAAITALFFALPHSVGWFGFVDGRLAPLILFLGLMAIHTPALGPTLRFAFEKLGPVFAAAIVIVSLVASYRFQAEARGFHEVLASVPTNTRLLNLPLDPNSDAFTGHPFVHYDKLVLAERPIVVSDVWFHQGSALYPRPENPALRLPPDYVSSDLRTVDWPAYHLEDWDYVLLRTRPGADAPVTPAALSLEEHRGGWWLYRSATAVPTLP